MSVLKNLLRYPPAVVALGAVLVAGGGAFAGSLGGDDGERASTAVTASTDATAGTAGDDDTTSTTFDDDTTSTTFDDDTTSTTFDDDTTSTTFGEDISGPCDEAEHAGDSRCTGEVRTDNSGPGSLDDSSGPGSGGGDDSSGQGSGGDDDDNSGHGSDD